ncbi:MAG: cysteine desulfurase [Proteobacteria bacterium]|nr:cysteine desulfurase [Pseudomonadota bacterium]
MIYLDHNATTPLCPEAGEAMRPLLEGTWGNPSGIHASARRTRAVIDEARDRLAGLLREKPHGVVFTGGGTESCNLALLGLARRHRAPSRDHLVTVSTEHHAVLHAMRSLARREGFRLTELPVDSRGLVDPSEFAAALGSGTLLASVMLANNETGVIQPIAELAAICREHGVFLHTDAVQAFGKIPCHPAELGVDALSATSHKFYGPHGAGFLWLRSGLSIESIQHGGYHENERRPGTENAAAITGMTMAAERAIAEACEGMESVRQAALREMLWKGIRELFPSAIRNAAGAVVIANTLNVSFPGCDGETLLMGLDLEGVAVSSGSACMVGSIMPSHVLLAMGVPEETARATVRFSLGRATTEEEIALTIAALGRVLARQTRR